MPVNRETVDQILSEYEIAKRALRWMLEHKVYWDPRFQALMEPVSIAGRRPFIEPPVDLAVFIQSLVREIDLEAEQAS